MESSNDMSVVFVQFTFFLFVKLKVLSYVVRFELSLYILIYGLNNLESVNSDTTKREQYKCISIKFRKYVLHKSSGFQ